MTWVSERSGTSRVAGAISIVLLAAILASCAGTGALGPAYGEMYKREMADSVATV